MKLLSTIVLLLSSVSSCLFANSTKRQPEEPVPQAETKPRSSKKSRLDCVTTPQIMRVFLSEHMIYKTSSPEIEKRTVKSFLESMDGMKTLLTKADYADLEKKLKKMFSSMRQGDCSALEEVRTVAELRSKESYTYMQKILGDSFKFDESVELVTNPEKREFAKDAQGREKFLSKYAHLQIARYLAADKDLKEAKELALKSYARSLKKIRELETSDLLEVFLNSFSTSLDPHSNYFSPKIDEEFAIDMTNSLEGIGASLSWKDGFTVVGEVIAGGPAEREKKLNRNDRILAVAQGEKGEFVPIIDMDLSDVVRLIRGEKGTIVRLRVLRTVEGKSENLNVSITRDKVSIKEQMARIHYEKVQRNGKEYTLAHLTLPSFYSGERGANRSAYNDTSRLLSEAKAKNVDGVLLNFSNNGGGVLSDAVNIAGLFIREGGITASKFVDGVVNVLADEDPSIVYSGPLVVLVNRFSASASEIVAGALKDYKRALIVGGDHTFGKGTIQQLSQLPDGWGALKYTVSKYFLPAGKSTQHIGVSSDIVLPSPFNSDEFGEKSMDYSLPPSSVKSFLDKSGALAQEGSPDAWLEIRSSWIKDLAEKSAKRVQAKEDFKEIYKEIEMVKKNDDVVKVKEFLAKSKEAEEKEKLDKDKRQIEIMDEAGRPYVQEGLDILADLIELQSPPASNKLTSSAKTKGKAPTL